jgi:hypothetical protein
MKKLHFQIFKLGFWVSLVLFSLTACQKDSEKTPTPVDPQPNGKLVKKIDFGGGDFQALTYNTHKQLIEFKDVNGALGEFTTQFEYLSTTDHRLKKAIIDGSNIYQYEYLNGKLIEIKQLSGNQILNEYSYRYDAAGRLSKIFAEGFEGSSEGSSIQTLSYDAKGNLNEVKLEVWNSASQKFELVSITYYQDFDDKKNVESWKLIFPNILHIQFHQNNPRKVVIKDAEGNLIAEATHTFEYDAQGYPTKVEIRSEQGEGPLQWHYNLMY